MKLTSGCGFEMMPNQPCWKIATVAPNVASTLSQEAERRRQRNQDRTEHQEQQDECKADDDGQVGHQCILQRVRDVAFECGLTGDAVADADRIVESAFGSTKAGHQIHRGGGRSDHSFGVISTCAVSPASLTPDDLCVLDVIEARDGRDDLRKGLPGGNAGPLRVDNGDKRSVATGHRSPRRSGRMPDAHWSPGHRWPSDGSARLNPVAGRANAPRSTTPPISGTSGRRTTALMKRRANFGLPESSSSDSSARFAEEGNLAGKSLASEHTQDRRQQGQGDQNRDQHGKGRCRTHIGEERDARRRAMQPAR